MKEAMPRPAPAGPAPPAGSPQAPSSRTPSASKAVFHSTRTADTRAIGERLGRLAAGDEVLALVGSLGAGKTCLVQGIGRGLGIRRTINSPTFVLMKRYEGRRRLVHWDWYRLEGEDDLESAGFGDVQVENGVVVIEWADRFLDRLAKPFLRIDIEPESPSARRLTLRVEGRSAKLARLVGELMTWWRQRNPKRSSPTARERPAPRSSPTARERQT